MNIFMGPALLIVLVAVELIVFRIKKRTIPWAEISMNLNSGQILLWLGRGLEVLGYYYIVRWWGFDLGEWLPEWAVILAAFVLWDHQFYWLHNLHHKIPLLWYVHEVHHQGEHFNMSLGIRNSWFSSLTSLPFFIPLALLGIPAETFVLVSSIHYFVQFYNHNDIVRHASWLERIFITPSLHKVHHGINPEYMHKNCGGTFSIWDRIYGTFSAELAHVPVELGLKQRMSTGNPFWVNILPFIKSRRPQRALSNDPWLNLASFILYMQLLAFIAVQEQISFFQSAVLIVFIFLGTLIVGWMEEGIRGAKWIWAINAVALGVLAFISTLLEYNPVFLTVCLTGVYTIMMLLLPLKSQNA